MEQVREVLRVWIGGAGLRKVAERAGVDRKTARRYVEAAEEVGVVRAGGAEQLSDEVIGQIVGLVRPARPEGHGAAWEALVPLREQVSKWVERGLTIVKINDLLGRQGVVVPYRTLVRFCEQCCGFTGRRPKETVRVADGDPGVECQLDFGEMGLLFDPASQRRRRTWALIFTAVYSRHMFVWLTHSQTLEALIAGCEAAWEYFGGVFKVLMTENVPRNIFGDDPARHPVEECERLNVRLGPGLLVHAQRRPHEHVP